MYVANWLKNVFTKVPDSNIILVDRKAFDDC